MDKCTQYNALIYCTNDPQLYIICIIYLLLFIFYFYRFVLSLISFFKTTKFSESWPQPTFWFCLLLNPLLSFLYYLAFTVFRNALDIVFFFVIRTFSNVFPYIVISVIALQFGIAFNPSASKNKEKRNIFLCLAIYIILFLACLILSALNVPFYQQLQDVLLLIVKFVSYLVFMIVSISMLNELHTAGIHYLPKNFFIKLTVGIHAISFFNLVHALCCAAWWGWQDCSGVSYKVMSTYYRRSILTFQMLLDLFGAAFPNLLLAFGIIYLNKVPAQMKQFQELK